MDRDTGKEEKSGTEGMINVGETGSKGKVETDREGSDNHEEEPILALERFPDPVWCKILGFLEAPKDFINVSKTCWDLNDIVERDRMTWVPPIRMVLPFVSHYLSKVDILTCRQVSSRLCSDMDRFLVDHPYRKFYSDANYTAPENLSILGTTLYSERYCDRDIVEEFAAAVKDHCLDHGNRNPFVGRTLHLQVNGSESWETLNRFIGNVMHRILRYSYIRNHFWYVKITGDHWFCDIWLLWMLFQKIFPALRNIRSVLVDLSTGSSWPASQTREFRMYARENPMPELCHSGPPLVEFTQRNGALKLLNIIIINQCHSQLSKIVMDLDQVEVTLFERKYQCPHLKTLRLSCITYHDVVFLERFEAPLLEQLTMDWTKGCTDFSGQVNMVDLGKILERFKNLRVLKLYSIAGSVLQLSSCIWNKEGNSCYPIPKPGPSKEKVQNHDRNQHESTIWKLIPQNVKEFHLDHAKFLRPRPNFSLRQQTSSSST